MVTRSKTAAKPKSETQSAAAPAKAATTKKTAVAKSAAAKPAAGKAVAAERKPAATTKKTPRQTAVSVTPEQRRYYVEVAAYYIAERRGFQGGSELDDWVQAEQEIDRLLRDGLIGG